MPALTAFYGLRPWDLERMTFGEVDEYLAQLAAYERAVEEAGRNGGS